MLRIAASILVVGICVGSVACSGESEADDAAPDGVAASSSDLTGSISVGSTLTTTARVNLREGPSTNDSIIRTMPMGATVKTLEAAPKNGFYHVSHEGQEGWAYGVYLKATSGTPSPTSPDAGPPGSPDDTSSGGVVTGSFTGRTFSGVTVLWQGNWSFLVRCDSYSRNAGHVVFFCDENPSRSFVDDGAWVAMPRANFSSGMCGQMARVCKGTKCIAAKIVEKSETAGQWEGSSAVLKALGVATGFSGCSSSFGTATGVTITMQR